MIFTDLQKAFDTIPHNIIWQKMKVISFCEDTTTWVKFFHSKQAFTVTIDKRFSNSFCRSTSQVKHPWFNTKINIWTIIFFDCISQSYMSMIFSLVFQYEDEGVIEQKQL